ncbi:MAG: phage major capsid protein, partial [Gammaproteobacteria bacterium]
MKTLKLISYAILTAAFAVIAFNAGAADALAILPALPLPHDFQGSDLIMLGVVGASDTVMKAIDDIEASLERFQQQAQRDIQASSRVSTETKNALDKFGENQREIAERLLLLEQRGAGGSRSTSTNRFDGWGNQIVRNSAFNEFISGSRSKARFEIQNNTLTGSDANVGPDRKPGVVPGEVAPMSLEALFPSVPTSSNAIEFTKEASFTNSAAEAAEGAARAESAITFGLVNMPISNVGHWIKISKQLAGDSAALAAYVNNRLTYGVNRRVETQLAVGNGTAPNISGIFDTGNYVPHSYANADLGSVLKKHVLIRSCMADLWSSGYQPTAIILNPADWAQFEIGMFTLDPTITMRADLTNGIPARLFGVPVVQSLGVVIDTFAVGAFDMAGTIHNRQDVIVEMSDSDSDNFTKGLIT